MRASVGWQCCSLESTDKGVLTGGRYARGEGEVDDLENNGRTKNS